MEPRSRRLRRALKNSAASEVALTFLDFHRAVLIVIDDAICPFRRAERNQLSDDLRHRVGVGANGSCAGAASERSQAAAHPLLFSGQSLHERLLCGNEAVAAHKHAALFSEVKRHDRNFFEVDVMPDVQFGPIGERKDANALAGTDASVVQIPQLRTLIFGVPLTSVVAEGENALFRARALFIAARSAECGIEAVGTQTIEQSLCLQQSAAALRSQSYWVCAFCKSVFITPDDKVQPKLACVLIAKGEHLAEFVARIDVQKRKRNRTRMKRLLGEAQHD